jgi:hypothetical protein
LKYFVSVPPDPDVQTKESLLVTAILFVNVAVSGVKPDVSPAYISYSLIATFVTLFHASLIAPTDPVAVNPVTSDGDGALTFAVLGVADSLPLRSTAITEIDTLSPTPSLLRKSSDVTML